MSDTPRTDEAQFGTGRVSVSFARQLERELNAVNAEIEEKRKDVVWLATEKAKLEERIKRLEAVVNDPHALWINWLRGDVKLPEGIGDVRQYQDRIKRLEEFARTIENDFDHDEDAHRYGTTCRVCDAEDLLKETKAKEDKL